MLKAQDASLPRALLPVTACLLLWGCGGRAAAPPPRTDAAMRAERVEPRREPQRADSPADESAPGSLAQGAVMEEDLDAGAPQQEDRRSEARDERVPDDADQPLRHILRRGQTLYSLAKMYDVDVNELIRINKISNPNKVAAGRPILIPAAGTPRDRPAARGTGEGRGDAPPGPQDARGSRKGAAKGEGPGSRGPAAPQEPQGSRATRAERLAWPLRGAITAAYGRRGKQAHHTGVDIDGNKGDPIVAAASGTVVQAGIDGEYGRMVVIDHGGGLTTLYAHASRLLVNVGDEVHAGDRIAEVGGSGNARGTHLHFEVRREDRPVDPVPLLRGRTVLTAATGAGTHAAPGTH